MYSLIRVIFFLFPAEGVHYFSMNLLRLCCSIPPFRSFIAWCYRCNSPYPVHLFGKCEFRNRVGLGAGFDKNARYLRELDALGFGFVEIGTVTPLPQKGNEKPRLFRLPKDKALINRMGFNNDGAKEIAIRLKKWMNNNAVSNSGRARMIIGGNIGNNKSTPNEDAWKDYEVCFRELFDCVDYFVVNVSSPNTPGLRQLQEKDSLNKILSHLQTINLQHAGPKQIGRAHV